MLPCPASLRAQRSVPGVAQGERAEKAQERAVQMKFLVRVLEAVRTGDSAAARQAMSRLVAGSAVYLSERSPELVSQRVRWGQL